jgi:NitT/TauT family transport system ATP-binding protein
MAWQISTAKEIFLANNDSREESRIFVLTPRPARLKEVMTVDLPRPRDPEMKMSSAFLTLKRTLFALTHDDAVKVATGQAVRPLLVKKRPRKTSRK